MIARCLMQITAISAAMTALAAAGAILIGWLVFTCFGAVTMVFLFVALNLALLFVFAGMVVGSLAAAHEREHPVAMAISAGALLCALLMLAVSGTLLDSNVVNAFVPLLIPVAAIRAWRVGNRQRTPR